MANKSIYPFGPSAEIPTNINIADDLNTNRADVALSAKQGKIIGDAIWGEAETEQGALGLADADIIFTRNASQVNAVTSADRVRLILQIPAGATINLSCTLNYGIAVSLYDTYAKCVPAAVNYIETYTDGYQQTVSNAVSTSAGFLCISYKLPNNALFTQQDYDAYMANVQVSITWTITIRDSGIMAQLRELSAKSPSEIGSLLYIGPVEQGVRGSESISTDATAVTMSNTVGVPFEKCKVRAFLPGGIKATFMIGTKSQTLSSGSTIGDGEEYQFPANVQYFCINFTITGESLAVEDFREALNKRLIAFQILNGDSSTISERNAYNEMFARAPMRKGVFTGYGQYLSIAHISDIHSDAVRACNFFEMCEHLGVQFAIHTGDATGWPYNGFSFLSEAAKKFSGKTINCNGNHDVFGNISQSDIFTKNIKPYTDALGITTDKCYYYVDDSTYKVRIIVLDAFEDSATLGNNKSNITGTQMNWFIAALESVPADYGVIICSHIPADNIVANDLGFYQQTLSGPFYILDTYGGGVKDKPIQKLVNAFIRKEAISGTYTSNGTSYSYSADFTQVPASAEFICHMNGHDHCDRIGYYTGYDGSVTGQEKQLVFNICAGVALYGTAYTSLAHCEDCPRGGKGSVQDAFNVLTIFRSTKKIQCTRIGSFITDAGAERLTATFDYQ